MRIFVAAVLMTLLGQSFAVARRGPKPTPMPEVVDEFSGKAQRPDKSLVLWYERPAGDYYSALPVGNGRIGAMLMGGASVERLWLNEDSLWASGPGSLEDVEKGTVERVAASIDKARKLMFEDKVADGQSEVWNALRIGGGGGAGIGCSQLLGLLDLHFAEKSSVRDYRRELDLEDAMVRVRYVCDGVTFTREFFSSHPDQVIVSRLEADKGGSISFVAKLTRGSGEKTMADGTDSLVMKRETAGGNTMQFIARVKAIAEGGKVYTKDNELHVEGVDAVTLLTACATDYLPKPPTFRGKPYEDISAKQIEAASKKSYADLRKDHLESHMRLFGRMTIDLGKSADAVTDQPTDARLKNFTRNGDPDLQELMFQYGRYLLISSSRPGSQPANLQGLWVQSFNPMWNGDYHLDLNIQMAYWAAGPCNMAECALPVADLVEWTIPFGRLTAKRSHGVSKGWVCHIVTNPHGYTAPRAHPRYGYVPACSAWLMQTLWEHYAFTQDKKYLRRVWPMFRETGEFWLEWLVPDPETGKLVSGPGTSPETSFAVEGGQSAGLSMGTSFDQQCVWELFTEILEAAKVLGIEDNYVKRVRESREKLLGPQVSSRDGAILEWAKETYVGGRGHRHRSHLVALYPGRQITVEHTPEWAKAAAKALDKRGMGGPPWTPAWDMSFNARLRRSKEAIDNVCLLFKLGRSIHPNMLVRCGGFQIDGNMGFAAGVAEMLIQSHAGHIELLPCLPEEWPDGSVRGICARGGYEIDMGWKDGKLVSASLLSKCGGKCKVRYEGVDAVLETEKGRRYDLGNLLLR